MVIKTGTQGRKTQPAHQNQSGGRRWPQRHSYELRAWARQRGKERPCGERQRESWLSENTARKPDAHLTLYTKMISAMPRIYTPKNLCPREYNWIFTWSRGLRGAFKEDFKGRNYAGKGQLKTWKQPSTSKRTTTQRHTWRWWHWNCPLASQQPGWQHVHPSNLKHPEPLTWEFYLWEFIMAVMRLSPRYTCKILITQLFATLKLRQDPNPTAGWCRQ